MRAVMQPGLLAISAVALFASGCSQGAEVLLCDGSPSVRLAFRNTGGGQVLAGSQVLSENGFNFLVVDGQCHYWARPDAYSDIREGQLANSEADVLTAKLRVADWDALAGDYFDDLCDGPTREYRFADQRINVFSSCGGPTTSQAVDGLLAATLSQLQSLYDVGAPVAGSVRFVLTVQDGVAWSIGVKSLAVPWPLSSDPSTLTLTFEQANSYLPGSSQSAPPPDADALRSVRRSFTAAGGLPLSGGFVPLLGSENKKYGLFARDSIPLEDGQGLLHLD